ncbi:MAG: maltose alpha-D-glucosyltransferase [Endomicrobiales bacterium]|nr:maltose alpha-D-glucosyltransferase [Endomicrobiales bacterium]
MNKKRSRLSDDPLWYKDAVIYQLHIKSFRDSSGDGIGDIRGLIEKLDYLKDLGVTAVWLLPFYPSPQKDDGYDISDYTGINPSYGTMNDFRELLEEAHSRNIRVITELVLNHTSDQHQWFQKSRSSKPGSSWRKFYVWNSSTEKYPDARIIFNDFETSNWAWDPAAKAYYWHRFYFHQPDLNFDNPRVQKAVLNVLDFWFSLGVDGVRLDAVPYLFEKEGTNCENLPETHDFLKKLRAHVDKNYRNKMLLAEANQWPEDAVAYFGKGDECHMAFNFPVMPRMFMAIQMENSYPIIDILNMPVSVPDNCQWALFLRNHDELTLEMVTDEERDYMYRFYAKDSKAKINLGIRRRLTPLLGNNRRKIELMNILLFSLPGTPIIYYGDEIGMGDNFYLGDRNGVRTPMQWSSDRNAGFSNANPHSLFLPLIIDPEYHYETVNVENQEKNLSSPLWWLRRVLGMRKRFKAFSRGNISFLFPNNNKVLAFTREYEDEVILVVINLSRFSQSVELDIAKYSGFIPEEVFSKNSFPQVKEAPYCLTLGPYNHFWFLLKKEKDAKQAVPAPQELPKLAVEESPKEIFSGDMKQIFEIEVLPEYIKNCRWFGGKARTVRNVTISETLPFSNKHKIAHLVFIDVGYTDGISETYFLPMMYATKEKADQLKQEYPQGIICSLFAGEEGYLYDAVYDKVFHEAVFNLIAKRKILKGKKSAVKTVPAKNFRQILSGKQLPLESKVLKTEQSNTSVVFDNTFIMKIYRKFEHGPNPDAEIVKSLSEKTRFANIPAFAGSVEYLKPGSEPAHIALMQSFVPNMGDAWTYTLENVQSFFDKVVSQKNELKEMPRAVAFDAIDVADKNNPLIQLAGELFLDMVRVLGKRTAEMHRALASISSKPFEPEPFSTLYQRSVYQSMRNFVRASFRFLEKSAGKLPKNVKSDAEEALKLESAIISRLGRIYEKKISTAKIRIHGDYHLGQVLYTGKDFVIIDFEGEPARSIGERRLKRSPLRDIAGMIRSFHYAVHSGLIKYVSLHPDESQYLESWAEAWVAYVSRIFFTAYMEEVGDTNLVPRKKEEFDILFEAFLTDKVIYELLYELNNRPDWIGIPLKGILGLIKSAKQG